MDRDSLAPTSQCFNPRPVIAHGATGAEIRIPTKARLFQSAPRDRSRGDLLGSPDAHQFTVFQSAPRDRSRGDFDALLHRLDKTRVSIRAP